jgi:rRNA small subunit pseudouridine methyltransferase Nep1
MINLIFVETALELVPMEIVTHPSIRRNAKRHGKPALQNLLDSSLHHFAMLNLPQNQRRGRPDIIHFCLLEAMGSPLNRTGALRVWINTQQGFTISVDSSTRFPRDYNRFKSLIEQLFIDKMSPVTGTPLLTLKEKSLRQLIEEIKPSNVIALTFHGEVSSFEKVAELVVTEKNPTILIGAYPLGALSNETLSLSDEALSVYHESLEAWTVVSRILYAVEKASGIF